MPAVIWLQASRSKASPAHPVIAAARGVSRRHRSAVRANRPPMDKSQARVGSEKYAAAGTTYVAASERRERPDRDQRQ